MGRVGRCLSTMLRPPFHRIPPLDRHYVQYGSIAVPTPFMFFTWRTLQCVYVYMLTLPRCPPASPLSSTSGRPGVAPASSSALISKSWKPSSLRSSLSRLTWTSNRYVPLNLLQFRSVHGGKRNGKRNGADCIGGRARSKS